MNFHDLMLDERPVQSSLDLRQRLRDLASTLWAEAEAADAKGEIARPTLAHLHDSGLALAPFPIQYGGAGLFEADRALELSEVLRSIGGGDLSMARIYEGHVNAVALITRYGSPAQISSIVTSVANGALSGVWGAEGAHGVHATRTPNGWRLSGGKILASGAGLLAMPLVTAATPAGPLLCLLDHPSDHRVDLSGWTPLGMRSSATGSIDLTDMEIPDAHVIGEPGDYLRQPYFSGGAWRFCAAHLGAAQRLVDLFRHHLVSRGRAGDPYQIERVAACIGAVTSARHAVDKAAVLLASDRHAPESVVAFTNLTRMITERAALAVMEAVQRGVGLTAFIRPSPIERVSRDLGTYLRQPVPDLAMADAARFVLASAAPIGDLWTDADES